MEQFRYIRGRLHVEGVSVRALAGRYGTPLYVYSRGHLRRQYRTLARAMAAVNPLICYSMKANANAAILKTLIREGAGVDVVSGGELYLAMRAGAAASKIVFAGVGKTREEIEYALKQGILFFTVESEPEAARISECAVRARTRARVAFRVNPDVNPRTHKYISTGRKENKFGLDIARTRRAYAMAAGLPGLEIAGIHMHIGSQILSAEPFAAALDKVARLCVDLKNAHPTLRYVDVGGGIGIRYRPGQQPLSPRQYAAAMLPILKKLGLRVIMEPGRYIVGNAGALICRVQYVKRNPLRAFIVADAGMNDLIRPALYEAHHEVMAETRTRRRIRADLVGPVCESGDFLASDRMLPAVKQGDLLAVMSAGAYGFSMASNYNGRPRPAEAMADGRKMTLVRKRESWKDMGGVV